jgi:hypothetical protein
MASSPGMSARATSSDQRSPRDKLAAASILSGGIRRNPRAAGRRRDPDRLGPARDRAAVLARLCRAPIAFPEMSRFEPVPLVLGAYIAITLSQAGSRLSPAVRGHPARRLHCGGSGVTPRADPEFPHPIHAATILFAEGLRHCCRCSFHRAPRSPCRCPDRSSSPGSCGGRLDGARRRGAIAPLVQAHRRRETSALVRNFLELEVACVESSKIGHGDGAWFTQVNNNIPLSDRQDHSFVPTCPPAEHPRSGSQGCRPRTRRHRRSRRAASLTE